MSENVAAEADRDRRVRAFRTQHLPNGLLRLDQVEAWISDRLDPPEATRQAVLGVPAHWDGPTLTGRPARVFAEQLEYVVHANSHGQRKPVAPGSVLDRLRHLAAGLAAAHGWEPAQAATWVLTGVTPLIGLIRVTEGALNVRDNQWTAWSERITLDVHPAVPPEEVTAAYRAARARLDHERTGGEYRARSLQVPQLVLARFVARRRPTTPWEQLRREWNAWAATQTDYTDLKPFDFESTFRRTATLARKRVLYRGLFARRGGDRSRARRRRPRRRADGHLSRSSETIHRLPRNSERDSHYLAAESSSLESS